MSRRSLVVLLLLACCAAAPAESWYISNRLGMKLEAIPRFRADEFDYVARESEEGEAKILTLYEPTSAPTAATEGGAAGTGAGSEAAPDTVTRGLVEVSRWERRPGGQGTVEERVFERGEHVSTRSYRSDGRLGSETLYVDGSPAELLSYRYSGGFLRVIESISPSGEPLWTTSYEVSPSGLLRGTRRTGTEPEEAAFGFAGTKLQEETLESDRHTVVLRYDAAGRRVVWETLGESLLRGVYSEYDPGSGNLAREEELVGAAERAERSYDAEGKLLRESSYQGEKLTATVEHRYDAKGRLVSSERRADGARQLTTYGYAADGSLAWEEERERGSLRRKIVYTGSSTRYEEVVQSGRLFVRAYFDGEEKVKEEVVRDGKIVTTRSGAEVR